MIAPKIGSEVFILDKPKGKPVNQIRWSVWSQSENGWHIFRRLADGTIEWRDEPARLLKPVRGATT